ncbi:von Willebrand factor type A domain-containing protein [Mycena metata]|uniref:von Willebrand factor type A domain-containing protein n=1 Tax=Mycena metata TaxID=1033252 RepID=A0AAD7HDJ5_9AGAR|nr:von Willebrand factor type A domain-containing protein [Mycena metata]
MSWNTPIYGLFYYHQHRTVSLPLLGVRAEASIKELAAQVKLTQTYGNDATFPIEAKYSFPIPARGSVCSFVMIKQDGTRVVGIVQEKQEARETYNTAVSQGQQASLMEQQTSDTFQVSVGNIPPSEQVQIELVYATELSEDEENDSIRFHLPVHIGARYGAAPQSTPFTWRNTVFISSSSPTPFLNILMSVEAIAPIAKIGSPSHTVSTELGPDPKLPNFKELPFSNYARVSLSSDSALDKDFVLTVKSAGLDTPRCIAELHPTNDTVAMGLTLVPRFKLPDVSRQEFVFMVDRSGSMGGKRIEAAKKALVVMLRALPHQDSLFQIVSFGTHPSSLWPLDSKPYNQETLEEATRHVDSMRADFGGTEMRVALRHCFRARKLDRPMSLLVLTDGDAWDLDGVFAEVKSAVEEAPQKAYLRVSVLGIGNSASTAMCEGIARIGNGTSMMVGEEETSFTGKIARMLKAAKTPPISNISVNWGRPASPETEKQPVATQGDDDEFEIVEKAPEKKKTLNIFDETEDDLMEVDSTPAPPPPPVVLAPPPPVQQAPFKIQNLFPNIRLNVYAILQGKSLFVSSSSATNPHYPGKTIPKTVTIRGSTVDGAEIELPITVALSHLQNAPGAPPAIHALAARKIIQDLEDGRHALVKTLANPDDTDLLKRTVKASIVRLGKTYSIASTHTSFVAVDETKPDVPPAPQVYFVAQPALYAPQPQAQQAQHAPAGLFGGGGVLFGSAPPGAQGTTRRAYSTSAFGSAPPRPVVPAAPSPNAFSYGQSQQQNQGAAFLNFTFKSAASPSLFGSAAPPPSASASFPPGFVPYSSPQAAPIARSLHGFGAPPASNADPLEALARLQSFDGCFTLEVLSVIHLKSGIEDVRKAFPAGTTDGVVATVLAMAFLSTKMGAGVERDSWEGIYEKAQQYVEMALQNMGVSETVEVLEAKVAALLA